MFSKKIGKIFLLKKVCLIYIFTNFCVKTTLFYGSLLYIAGMKNTVCVGV